MGTSPFEPEVGTRPEGAWEPPPGEVRFIVPGKPLTWARARRGKSGPMFTPVERENKMSEVRDSWRAFGAEPFPRGTYIGLSVIVYCIRPENHWSKRGGLKPWALHERPGAGTNGGDLDNFVKLVKDALNKVAYYDDSQIVEYGEVAKHYHEAEGMPRTEVALWQVVEGQEENPEQGDLLAATG